MKKGSNSVEMVMVSLKGLNKSRGTIQTQRLSVFPPSFMSAQLTLQIEQFYDATGPSCTCTTLSLSSEGHGINIGPIGDPWSDLNFILYISRS
jgi:hypothetical protein